MSVPPIIQYPLDLTGKSETNKIVGERRDISNNTLRAFVPVAGPFYANSFSLYNAETMALLVPVDDYVLAQPHAQAALRSGMDVQSAVILKVQAPISVVYDYQVVGGEYSWNLAALQDLIAELDLDESPVSWGAVIGRPIAYPPTPHIHDLGDTFGWEYVVWQLERISNAILVGDEASHDELRAQIQYARDQLMALIDAVNLRVDDHLSDFSNPHQVTKAQVSLGSVDNFPTASSAEALAGTANNRFMTPAGVAVLAEKIADGLLDAHLADTSNPHNVTKEQVGLGSVDNFTTATQAEAIIGVVNNRFMTPLRTKEAIMAIVGDDYLTHKASTSNPHQVTKAQVGLGSVDNFSTATSAEAIAGIVNNRFMTPLRTKEAIDSQVGADYRAHKIDTSNPHQVTKSQVGLGSVENYAIATTAEATSGTINTKYMTPLRTKEAIMAIVGNDYAAHKASRSNPHVVTAAQVGAYTTTQTDTLLNAKLGKTETAADSSKLGGSTKTQVLAEAYAQVGSMGKRNLYISTSDPAAGTGVVGDVWFKY